MENQELEKRYEYLIYFSMGIVALTVLMMPIHFKYFVDVPSILIVGGMAAIGYYWSKEYSGSFVLGGVLASIFIALTAIILNLKDMENFAPAMAVCLLPFLYLFMVQYFVLNIIKISEIPNQHKNTELNKNPHQWKVVVSFIALMILVTVLSGISYGIFSLNSAVGVLGILSSYIIKDRYKQLQLMKNYVVGYILVLLFIAINVLLLEFNNLEVYREVISHVLLNTLYMTVFYLLIIRPKMISIKDDVVKFEIVYYGASILSVIVLAIMFTASTI